MINRNGPARPPAGPGAPSRVALVTWNFPVISEPFVSTLALDLLAAGQDVQVLTFDTADQAGPTGTMHPEVEGSDLLARTGRAGARVPLRTLLLGPAPVRGLLAAALPGHRLGRARLVARQGPFEVVHCQFANLALAAQGLRRARLLRTRVLVVHIRGHDITTFVEQHGRDVYRTLFAQADLMVANCRHFRDKALALGCPAEKVAVIGSPIDCARFAPPAARLPLAGRALRLVAVGRLADKKGFADAIAAVGLLRQAGRKVGLDIFGEGRLRAQLERQIADLGLGQAVTLHGHATQTQILAGLHRADIALAPSVRAASGDEDGPVNTLKEAMATGLPVVGTRHGGIPELVIPGENGALVAEHAPHELAAAIADLADRPGDWPRLGAAGRALIVARYDRAAVRDRTLAAYRACLDGAVARFVAGSGH